MRARAGLFLGVTCVACAAAAPAHATFALEPGSPIASGGGALALGAADFNADARPDLVVGNRVGLSVSSLLRQPAGGFATETGSPFSATSPNGLVIADVNGDQRPDVVTTGTSSATVLLRGASGGFVAEGSPPPTPNASDIATADLNADGRPDIVVNDTGTDEVKVFLRLSAAAFAAAGIASAVPNDPRVVDLADFTGDGRGDIVSASAGGEVVVAKRSAGSWTDEGSLIDIGDDPAGMAVGDFNADGLPDVAISRNGLASVAVLLRQPGGGFAPDPASPVPVGAAPQEVVSGDFDADGNLDFAVASSLDGTVSVKLRRGTGFVDDPSSPIATGAAPIEPVVADFNADGRSDLAVTNFNDGDVSVLLNTTPPPPPPVLPPVIAPPAGTAPAVPSAPRARLAILNRRLNGTMRTRGRTSRFTALSVGGVRAGDVIRLSCRGRGCPTTRTVRVRRAQRTLSLLRHVRRARLRRGAVFELRVARPGTIGRVLRFTVRAPRAVAVSRLCLTPGAARPRRC